MQTAIAITPEMEEVQGRSLTILEQAKCLVIRNAEDYMKAGALWKDFRAVRSKISETFDPLIKGAHALHKNTIAKKDELDKPLEGGERHVKSVMNAWDAEQERIRQAEQARLAEIARQEEEKRRQEELAAIEADRKAEEERLLQAALEAEASGDKAQAEELMQVAQERTEEAAQVAAEIQAAPVYVPPVVVPKSTPKLAGGPVYQTRWYAQVTNVRELCHAIGAGTASTEFVIGLDRNKDTGIITSPSLNKQATSLMDKLTIPGVKAYSKRV